MNPDKWKELSVEHHRKSKGEPKARSKNEDFDSYVGTILSDAKKYSDYESGSEEYKDELHIIDVESGKDAVKKQIKRDIEYERTKRTTKSSTSNTLIKIDMSENEDKMLEAYYESNIKDRTFDNEGSGRSSLNSNDSASLLVLEKLFTEYKNQSNYSGMDATMREIQKIQQRNNLTLSDYSFTSHDITTVVSIQEVKTYTLEDIHKAHKSNDKMAYIAGLIPEVGTVLGPLYSFVNEMEQNNTAMIGKKNSH